VSGATVRRLLPFGLLLVLFALLVFSVTMKSPTLDEQNHVARGLAYLKTGDLRLSQEHPPGINAWETWPLLLDPRIRLPLESPSWANAEWYGFADQLLWRGKDHPQAMVFAARVPVMWLTLLLAALAYRWAHDLGGPQAGLVALALLALDPNILAHGRLATTDMGVTCLALAAAFALWRAVQGGTWRRWVLAGAALGAAQLSKFSALTLLPSTLLIVALAWAGERAGRGQGARPPRRWAWRLLALAGTACALVWAGYGLSWGPIGAAGGLVGPAPAYWDGIQSILRRTSGGSPSFLMGQYSQEGWWTYFPIAFAIKTPLPTLLLLALALGTWVRRRAWQQETGQSTVLPRPSVRPAISALCLALPALTFWSLAVGGSFNVGYRHILPSLPFLYVLAAWQLGQSAGTLVPARAVLRGLLARLAPRPLVSAACGVLFVWLAWDALSTAPHFLTFFNAVAGGPDGGYRFLVDSNLDWGQDLPALARYVREHGNERIYLSWFGAAHPEAYDFPFHPLPGFWRFGGEPAAYGFNPYAPAPGTYAISVTNLQGLTFADHDLYAWFRSRAPDARIGHSIWIYRVDAGPPGEEAVVLGVPLAQLGEEERALLARASSVRRYEPSTGSILPGGSYTRVWLITPVPVEGAQEVRSGPGYVVSYTAAWPEPPSLVYPAPRFDDLVALWAYTLPAEIHLEESAHLEIHAQWRVTQPPHRSATSFAHLLDAQGRYVTGWDGVAAPATCWQEGDALWQSYNIPLPPGLPPGTYQVEVGWYDAETGTRWPCSVDGEHVGDRYLLPNVEIRS
jgi:hypothetical protein